MRNNIKRCIFILLVTLLALGCSGEEDTGMGTNGGQKPPPGDGIIPMATIVRPSPCMRVAGNLQVSVSTTTDAVLAYIILHRGYDTWILDVLTVKPFYTVIPASELSKPRINDGTYTLEALVLDAANNFYSASVEIRLDNEAPFENNILVVDSDADPFGLGGAYGAVFRINTGSGNVCALASTIQFSDPRSIVLEPDGTILVSDLTADLNGLSAGTGALFRVSPDQLNIVTPVLTAQEFRAPVGLDITPNTIYLADYEANPFGLLIGVGETAPGAIFAIDPVTNAVTTVVSVPIFESPIGIIHDAGNMYITDTDADPLGFGVPHGAIFFYDGNTVIEAASTKFATPYELVSDGAGKLVLSDSGAGGRNGRLFLIDPNNPDPVAAVSLFASGGLFVRPSGIIRTADGLYLVADRDAEEDNHGAIIQYDPATAELRLKYRSDQFVNPFDLVESPK